MTASISRQEPRSFSGARASTFPPPSPRGAYTIAIGGGSDFFDRTGFFSENAGGSPLSFSVVAAPEPSSLPLLLAGTGILACVLLARRKTGSNIPEAGQGLQTAPTRTERLKSN